MRPAFSTFLWALLAATAAAQGYGGDWPVPDITCLDGAAYTSAFGAVNSTECLTVALEEVTADECGRACAAEPECSCATYDRGACSLLQDDCCRAEVLRPCRDEVVDQGRQFNYVDGGAAGTAYTTRYWDCAKPSCAWPGKAPVTQPPRVCRKDGLTTASPTEQSGAGGGTAFACTNQQPWTSRYDPNLAFAYVAFSTPSGGEARSCCTCLEMTFKDPRLAGKRLIGQVINMNNGETGEHVDIAVPGGGIGAVNACQSQWNAGASWGQLFGGLGPNRIECEGLPEQLRPGCRWQYDWLLDVRSDVDYREIHCPGALLRQSRCQRT